MSAWFILEDGSVGDPSFVSPDKDGKLRHKDGRAVAYGPHGPRSRVPGPAEIATPVSREAVAPEDRELRPHGRGRGYRTR